MDRKKLGWLEYSAMFTARFTFMCIVIVLVLAMLLLLIDILFEGRTFDLDSFPFFPNANAHKYLFISGVFFYLKNLCSFFILSKVTVLSHAVATSFSKYFLIVLYENKIIELPKKQIIGPIFYLIGLFLYYFLSMKENIVEHVRNSKQDKEKNCKEKSKI